MVQSQYKVTPYGNIMVTSKNFSLYTYIIALYKFTWIVVILMQLASQVSTTRPKEEKKIIIDPHIYFLLHFHVILAFSLDHLAPAFRSQTNHSQINMRFGFTFCFDLHGCFQPMSSSIQDSSNSSCATIQLLLPLSL